jgi:hypothetical protein
MDHGHQAQIGVIQIGVVIDHRHQVGGHQAQIGVVIHSIMIKNGWIQKIVEPLLIFRIY